MSRARYLQSAIGAVAAALLLCAAPGSAPASQAAGPLAIVVIKSRDTAFYGAAVQGFVAGLKRRGYRNGEQIQITVIALPEPYNAKLRDQLARHPALIVPFGTDATRAVSAAQPADPVLFSMILDPVALGVIRTLDAPGSNYTGSTLLVSPGKQFEALLRVTPHSRKIGVIYTEGDKMSGALLQQATEDAKQLGLSITGVALPSGQTPASALEHLTDVDALWMIPDPISAGPDGERAQIEYCRKRHLPLLGASESSVANGALLALSPDINDLGDETADMAVQLLEHTAKPDTMRVRGPRKTSLAISLDAARAAGLRVPPDMLHLADQVIDTAKDDNQ